MEFTLAYIKGPQQLLIRDFSQDKESKAKIVSWDDLEELSFDAMMVPQNLADSPELMAQLESFQSKTPVRKAPACAQSAEDFENASFMEMESEFLKNQRSWALQNNLFLLENLFTHLTHLKEVFSKDRTSFFEELWNLLKNNLAATEVKIVFNHLQKAQKEHEKNKLIRIIVEGEKVPNPVENTELGASLMKNYEGQFLNPWEIVEYDQASGKLVATASINKSPILFMAKIDQLSALQRSLIKSLFDGLQA